MSAKQSVMLSVGHTTDTGQSSIYRLPISTINKHMLVNGCTGWGKSGFLLSILLQLLRIHGAGIVLIDMKGGTADELRLFLSSITKRAPRSLLVIAPFKGQLVPLNPLAPVAGLNPRAQANTVAGLLEALIDGIGQRMRGILTNLVRIVMALEGSLLDVLRLLTDEAFRTSVAALLEDEELRYYLTVVLEDEPKSSRDSLRARLDWLLLLPEVRAMLTAKGCLSGSDIIEAPLAILDLSGAPMGFAAAARFVGSWLWQVVCAGIFARPSGGHPVSLCCDEWQELVKFGHEDMERVLSLARFKNCHLQLANQTLAQISSVSPALTASVLENTALRVAFRPESSSIRDLLPLLPITGRMVNPLIPDQYLSRSEERDLYLRKLLALPPRHALIADRVAGTARIIKTLDLPYQEAERQAKRLTADIRSAWQWGTVAVSLRALEVNQARITPAKSQSTPATPTSKEVPSPPKVKGRSARPKLVLP